MTQGITLLDTPCLEWPGGVNHRGYGFKREGGQFVLVHRWIWAKNNGPIPDGLFVLHRCDNPPCYKLTHLFLGTHDDNMADMVAKGRTRDRWGRLVSDLCPYCGNPFDQIVSSTGQRRCTPCRLAYQRHRYALNRDTETASARRRYALHKERATLLD